MTNEEQVVRGLTLDWLDCWRIDDDKPWSHEDFRPLQVADEIFVCDDYGGHLYVFTGNEGYRTIWGPLVEENMRTWKIGPEGDIKVKVSGELAYSSFVLVGGGTLKDGSPAKLRQYCTFVWERMNGEWKMSIEHISTDNEYST